ncbi:hypothetical protein COCSADRAFT_355203 [Bipolaris sorokiniana ND90Pr]|uniref:Uncharacterized protein n=1 Tax=Cochliobolus sativus (strain ND90Pr / ATCC 201652) TaxID=665912 RepID=M2SEU3_COCSN|nr:uncharacterized protein COCSADRAFT_355203 [Bipolaris sorokiniana ND90Pr]EMD65823.1 hypothetical protein COCSADRAFT_355203 [Bipolaris sorokiniana ND90Pr]
MDSKRLTIFPRTTNGVEDANTINRRGGYTELSALKRKLNREDGLVERKLSKPTPSLRVKRKIFTPLDEDPGRHYRCIHIVDPEGERPYCLAQEIASAATENAYRVVMIRRSLDKSIYGLGDSNPNLLNIVSVFRFQGSLFTVFDRPGFPLSEIAMSHSPPLGLAEMISQSQQAMVESKLVALDRANLQESTAHDKATAFGTMLDNLVSHIPDSLALQQSQDLLAFIQHTTERSYLELRKVITSL